VQHVVATLFREEWGRIVAALIHRTGDWDLAEECAQDAFAQALARWPEDGLPPRPGAWLMTVARNRAIDRLRRGNIHATKLKQIAALAPGGADGPDEEGDVTEQLPRAQDGGVPDERLRLIFTCCHPAVAMEARVALTLRTLAGLTTAEIARAFLVPEATMAKRLVRAKQKITHAGIPYRVPPASALPQRTAGVLAVLYLLFNEGYSASAGAELVRKNLCDDAVMLARVLAELMPEEPEVKGLLALMMFHRSRQAGRVDDQGDLVTLEAQDRTLWDQASIEQAKQVLDHALAKNQPGPYQLQAAIAGCHALSPQAEMTDWSRIANLYDQLVEMTGSPVVELNRAVAVAMADGPAVGLALVNGLAASGALRRYYLLAATRADLLRRLGRRGEAAAAYREALALVATGPEERFLTARLAEVTEWSQG
jgi:RNA polymerase sigma-70 factor (ECF subfamily)